MIKIKKPKSITEDAVDPNSKTEIADEVKDQADLGDKEADKLASDIKQDAENTGAVYCTIAIDPDLDYEDTDIKNDITDALDEAFADAKYFNDAGETETSNVLIEGLPGSGKTAIVSNWCDKHGLTLLAFNATDPKLEASLNGIPLRDLSFQDNEETGDAETQRIAYAYNLQKVDKLLNNRHPELAGKCVIFVDELNRQKSQQLRRPFMSLFNEKRNADGTLDFRKNLLFSVICINPYGDQFHDPGVGELVPAELNRFLSKITFDSTTASSKSFFNGWLRGKLLDLGIIPPGTEASIRRKGFVGPLKELDQKTMDLAKTFIKRYELAMFILNHEDFRFDERSDAHKIWSEHKDYLTSRLFTNGIAKSQGDPQKFLNWVDTKSGLSSRVVKMFHEILDSKIFDWNEVWNDYGLNQTKPAANNNDTVANSSSKTNNDIGQEDSAEVFDDDDVASAGNKTSGTTTSSNGDIKNIMKSWANNW